MRLLDLLFDKLIGTSLYEMARTRDDAKRIVTGLSVLIFEHLIKLFVFALPQTKKHWIRELNGFFYRIDDIYLKPSNKKINDKTLYNWMVYDASPHYTPQWITKRVEKMITRDYQNVNVYDYDAEHLLNVILRIINQICTDISNDEFKKVEYYLPIKK